MQPTIADALTAPTTGAVPLEILRDRLADVVVLDEDELAAGFRLAYARGRVACEVAGSAPIGALAAGRVDTAGAPQRGVRRVGRQHRPRPGGAAAQRQD